MIWILRLDLSVVGNMPNSTWLRHARWKQKLQIWFNHVCFRNLARIMSTCWLLLNPLGGIRVIPCCANQENCKNTPKQEFIHQVLIIFKAWPWNSHFPCSWFWIIPDQPFYYVLFPRLLIFHLKRLASCFPAPFLAPISTIKWRNRRLCLSKWQHHRDDVALSIHLAVKSSVFTDVPTYSQVGTNSAFS